MIAQLAEDLVHLERGQDGLDQHRGPDGALRDAQRFLGHDEDVVPQPRLEMALQLGQVEVGAGAAVEQRAGVVEEVQAKVEQRGRDRLTIDQDVLLDQMPAARPHHQRGRLVVRARRPCRPGW